MKFKVGNRFPAIPEGQYKAIVKDIKASVVFKRPSLTFVFEIAEGVHKESQLNGFVNANYESFSSHTKLRRWFSVVAGEMLESGDELDTDTFFDKLLLIQVETKVSKRTKNPFSNVTDVLKVLREI